MLDKCTWNWNLLVNVGQMYGECLVKPFSAVGVTYVKPNFFFILGGVRTFKTHQDFLQSKSDWRDCPSFPVWMSHEMRRNLSRVRGKSHLRQMSTGEDSCPGDN